MEFAKYQGLGNDFIIIEARENTEEIESRLDKDKIFELCRRKYGVGADGIILLEKSQKADFRMKLFNSDGSKAELSGNGLRCLALFVRDEGIYESNIITFETGGGITRTEISGQNSARVWMPKPVFERKKIPMTGEGECVECKLDFQEKEFTGTALSVGNPHLVIFQTVKLEEVKIWGPVIEKSDCFPQRVNVDFVEAGTRDRIKAVFYERGAGITEACGSGSCAAVAAGIKTGRLYFNTPVKVEMEGGELTVTISADFEEVILEGEARKVFSGRLDLQD